MHACMLFTWMGGIKETLYNTLLLLHIAMQLLAQVCNGGFPQWQNYPPRSLNATSVVEFNQLS